MEKFDDDYSENRNKDQLIQINGKQNHDVKDENKGLKSMTKYSNEEIEDVKHKDIVDNKNLRDIKIQLDGQIFGDLDTNETSNGLEKSDWSEKRIKELENALRETIQISTERETVLQNEENKRKSIMQKVNK